MPLPTLAQLTRHGDRREPGLWYRCGSTNWLRPCRAVQKLATRRELLLAAAALLAMTGCAPAAEPAAEDVAKPPATEASFPAPAGGWRLFRGNGKATGVASSPLPEKLDQLWTFSVAEGGFEATAVIDGGAVYVGSTDGKFYALDLAGGRKRWEFSTELGFTAAAAIRDGSVYVGDSDGRFYCLDARTGGKRWHFDTEAEINSGANFYKDRLLVGSQDGKLYCLSLRGKVVWEYQSEDQIRCFPTVVENRAFVAGCDGRLHMIDLETGKQMADVDLRGPTGCSPAILGDLAFVGTEGEKFFAVDWRRAEVAWSFQSPKRSMPYRSSAAVTAERVVVGSRDKNVYALEPKSGRPLWTFPTRRGVDSSPVVVGKRVFVGSSDGRLYGLDAASGKELWRFECGGSLVASPAVAGRRLVIGNDDGQLYCFGAKE